MERNKRNARIRSVWTSTCAALFVTLSIVLPAVAENSVIDSNTAGKGTTTKVVTASTCHNIDQLVGSKVATEHGTGVAIAVIENDKIVFQKCYGYANVSKRIPVTPKTIFGMASITKTFTSTALLKLVEQGKIDLNKPINSYLVDPSSRWKDITVLQLANMTSGLPHDLLVSLPWVDQYDVIKMERLAFKPGTQVQYSNIGYRLLGQIIENVSGQSYLDYVRKVILAPIGMKSTGSLNEVASTGLLAVPYVVAPGGRLKQVTYHNAADNYAAGMLFSNLDDMAKYARALLNGKILSGDSYDTMWFKRSKMPDGTLCYWAFGWANRLADLDKKRYMVGMNGELPGIAANIILFPDSKVAIITLSNMDSKINLTLAYLVSQLILP
jgi:CubicO group peptidase (beta-lactamase class C family)